MNCRYYFALLFLTNLGTLRLGGGFVMWLNLWNRTYFIVKRSLMVRSIFLVGFKNHLFSFKCTLVHVKRASQVFTKNVKGLKPWKSQGERPERLGLGLSSGSTLSVWPQPRASESTWKRCISTTAPVETGGTSAPSYPGRKSKLIGQVCWLDIIKHVQCGQKKTLSTWCTVDLGSCWRAWSSSDSKMNKNKDRRK